MTSRHSRLRNSSRWAEPNPACGTEVLAPLVEELRAVSKRSDTYAGRMETAVAQVLERISE